MKCLGRPRRVCPVKGSKSQILGEEVELAVLGLFCLFAFPFKENENGQKMWLEVI